MISLNEVDLWDLPLSPEAIESWAEAKSQLEIFSERVEGKITELHRQRLDARERYGIRSGSRYQPSSDSTAACSFERFEPGMQAFSYSGVVHWRGESDSFGAQDCEPLPAHLLTLSKGESAAWFNAECASERARLDEAEAEAERTRAEQLKLAEHTEYLRLSKIFGDQAIDDLLN